MLQRTKRYMKQGAVFLVVCVLGLTLFQSHTTAQAVVPNGPTISPTYIDQKIKPGGIYKGEAFVLNKASSPYVYRVYATPYTVNGEAYEPYFLPIKGSPDISTWFTFEKQAGRLENNQQDTIPFRITVPPGTGAGSYYATIFAETVETKDNGHSSIITRKRVGCVVYIRVPGKAIETGGIETWDVPKLQKPDLHATLRLSNTGSVYYRSHESIEVSDLFGHVKYRYIHDYVVLPQKIRRLVVRWDNGSDFGLFKVTGKVTIFGKTEQLPAKYVFVVSPRTGLIALAGLAGFSALIALTTKRYLGQRKRLPYNKKDDSSAHSA